MKKWNIKENDINSEKYNYENNNHKEKLSHLNSFYLYGFDYFKNREELKIYKKPKPILVSSFHLINKRESSINFGDKNKYNNLIYYKKNNICNYSKNTFRKLNHNYENRLKLRTDVSENDNNKIENYKLNQNNLDDLKLSENNVFKRKILTEVNFNANIIQNNEENKEFNILEDSQNENNNTYKDISLSNCSQNSEINNFVNELKSKIDLSQRTKEIKNGKNISKILIYLTLDIDNLHKFDFKYELLLISYLDDKSLILLSSINKYFFKVCRIIIYKRICRQILNNKTKNKENFIKKIFYNLFNYCSSKLNFRNKIQLKTKYAFYQYNSAFKDKIKQDLSRTFPKDNTFNNFSNYIKLYNILIAYSNYNKSIGYTQGLNFIAATGLYIFQNEEEVFLLLDCLINRFKLEKYLSIENINLCNNYKYFCDIIKKYAPEVVIFFEEKNLDHCFFSFGWMLTLFSNSMKRKNLIKVWCFMILLGWKFFYSFVIQILLFYKDEILMKEENKISSFMKNILNNESFCNNFNLIVEKTLYFMVKNIIL